MEEDKNLQNIAAQVKNVDNDINKLIIPILKDTIQDGNTHNHRLFLFAMGELVVLILTIILGLLLIYKQNIKYQEFLSQFDFETVVYQDTDNNSSINSGINFNK